MAPFRPCISKTNSTLIDNAEDLNIVMPIYNSLEYSQHYYMTSGSLCNYYEDEIDDVNDNASDGNLFKYKTKKNMKYIRKIWKWRRCKSITNANFKCWSHYSSQISWISLDLPLINREIELVLSWTKGCLLIEQNNNITGVNFVIFRKYKARTQNNLKEQFLGKNIDLKYQHNQKTM